MIGATVGLALPAEFARFTPWHAGVVLVSAALIGGLVRTGRRARRSSAGAERAVRASWIAGVVAIQGFTQVWVNLPARADLGTSLPLHICDLVPWIGILALVTPSRWARALAYFWGLGLSGWAFIIPVLTHGPARAEFWLFWAGHLQIVGTAVYLLTVLGDRPSLVGLRRAAVATIAYGVAIVGVNVALDADYGYLGPTSVAEPLGPWPWRAPVLVAIEILIFALLLLPWRARRGGEGETLTRGGRTMRPEIKPFGDLTPADFERNPIWVSCHTVDDEEPWYDEVDEEAFRPWTGSIPVDPAKGMFLVRAAFTFPDGETRSGFVTPSTEPDELGLLQPQLFLGGRRFAFWGGMMGVDAAGKRAFYEACGRTGETAFPLAFAAEPGLAEGCVTGRLEGFSHSPDLERVITEF